MNTYICRNMESTLKDVSSVLAQVLPLHLSGKASTLSVNCLVCGALRFRVR